VILEICLDIFRLCFYFFDVQSVMIACYCVIHFLVAILYFIAAYRILKITSESADKARLRTITLKIVASGIATMVVMLFMVLFLANVVSYPVGQFLNMFLSAIALFFQSFFVILIFEFVKKKQSSSGGKKSSSLPSISNGAKASEAPLTSNQ